MIHFEANVQEFGHSVSIEWTSAMPDYGAEERNLCPCRGLNSGRPSHIVSFTDTVEII